MISKNATYSVGILAGGKSTRMGQNKAFLEFCNETFIGRIINEFKRADEVIVSASSYGTYERNDIKVVYDENKDIGPLEGIRQILLASTEKYVFICASDMPFVNKKVADLLAGYISSDNDCYVICDEERFHPLCAIYSKDILPVIEELISEGKYKLRFLLERTRTKLISLNDTGLGKKVVRNVNTKEEYQELMYPVIFAVSGYKNSGKTWLICELINEFIDDGHSVGVVKHDGHDMISCSEGTDTYKFMSKGALSASVFSNSGYVLNSRQDISYEEIIRQMSESEPVPHFIILEGFKDSSYPKIEIHGDGSDEISCCSDPDTVFMHITNLKTAPDVKYIYRRIKEEFNF